jgi:TRAP-type C4-dicarboxylate transport system permease small subunit
MKLGFLKEWARRLSDVGEWIGIIGIILMVGVTCLDVIGAKLFLLPVPGAIEIVSLLQVAALVFAVAATQRRGGHISVEMFVDSFPKTIRHLTKALVSLCCLVLFTLLIYEGVGLGNEYLEAGEVTASAQIPFYPFAYLFSFALIPVFIMLLIDCIEAVKEAVS